MKIKKKYKMLRDRVIALEAAVFSGDVVVEEKTKKPAPTKAAVAESA